MREVKNSKKEYPIRLMRNAKGDYYQVWLRDKWYGKFATKQNAEAVFNKKNENPKYKSKNVKRKVANPRFAVSLESQHGTKPVGIIEAPNFLSAYNAAKKEYGPDIDVDVMNPIRRYVVTKRKKATHGRMR